ALRFSHCNELQVRGLKHRNSQKNHVSINGCNGATISNLDIRAPAKSPNTDGIDISASSNLHIHNCLMATGDDCIAINGGTSNVDISNIACGPGHGISIGSLGKDGRHDEVEGISITNSIFTRTDNGVRIKTWQGGSGFARNITFSKITFVAANNPVIIDQYYCPHKKCANKTSAVKVSHVRYSGLHGTSICKNATINFSCSQTVPCTDIVVDDVDIESVYPNDSTTAHCINAHGTAAHALHPAMDCLRN
ncbi:UNVERIFIED_CONTAM: putative polygalacturonase, partial [Sesamum indicum]